MDQDRRIMNRYQRRPSLYSTHADQGGAESQDCEKNASGTLPPVHARGKPSAEALQSMLCPADRHTCQQAQVTEQLLHVGTSNLTQPGATGAQWLPQGLSRCHDSSEKRAARDDRWPQPEREAAKVPAAALHFTNTHALAAGYMWYCPCFPQGSPMSRRNHPMHAAHLQPWTRAQAAGDQPTAHAEQLCPSEPLISLRDHPLQPSEGLSRRPSCRGPAAVAKRGVQHCCRASIMGIYTLAVVKYAMLLPGRCTAPGRQKLPVLLPLLPVSVPCWRPSRI